MAFHTLWRKWMKECVGTTTASILVNESPTSEFPMRRRLRQGDLFSPFLLLIVVKGLNVMMTAATEANMFTGYSIGSNTPIVISHLQFVDDTLLLGVKSRANVRAFRAVLFLFEAMSGLKVNFDKSLLVGVNIDESWVHEATYVLSCKIGRLPFIYMGLLIGSDARYLIFWEPVIYCIKAILSVWKSRNMSFSGHLTLLQSFLSSLPVYTLSFFRTPSGNWCWRCLVDRNGLWYKVLSSRYGEERGERFRRLFDLSVDKYMKVTEMYSLGWDEGGEAWGWRRQLFALEEDLGGECRTLLSNVTLQDVRQWHPNVGDGYTVCGVYQMPMRQEMHNTYAAATAVWHKNVPLKVSICAWHLLRNRWSTKDKLVRCDIIPFDSQLCVTGCDSNESADHHLIHCPTFGEI
ncbi:uncharacterized protein [Medicago truncatula]|uniref:uncharacterized protein n=1 Tax=Medicago truncatula TaxID=3880 RepID=UPI000D2F3ACF|nr:uncharacterized protein LOC112420850 [Medicago truncatula]